MKRFDRDKLVFAGFAALTLAVALAGFLLAVQPQRTKAQSLAGKIADAQTELASLHTGGTKAPSIRAAELFQLSRAMPDVPDMPGILLDLLALSGSSSVSLVTVKPTTPAVLPDGATALPLSVTVDGSWSGISRFLRNLRTQVRQLGTQLTVAGRVFDVDNVQIQPGSTGGGIEAVLTMSAFTYGKPVPAPAATGTASTSTGTTTTSTTPASSPTQQAVGSTGAGG